jgi:hypothetical protein
MFLWVDFFASGAEAHNRRFQLQEGNAFKPFPTNGKHDEK